MRMGFVAALALLAGACTVDTELGVAAEFQSADIRVTGAADTTVVAVDIVTDFRVGEHAQGGARQFVVDRASLLIMMSPVAEIPVGGGSTLDPGQRETITLVGMSRPGDWPMARDQLCNGGPTVQVLVSWSERTVDPPPAMPPMPNMAEFTTMSITCD